MQSATIFAQQMSLLTPSSRDIRTIGAMSCFLTAASHGDDDEDVIGFPSVVRFLR